MAIFGISVLQLRPRPNKGWAVLDPLWRPRSVNWEVPKSNSSKKLGGSQIKFQQEIGIQVPKIPSCTVCISPRFRTKLGLMPPVGRARARLSTQPIQTLGASWWHEIKVVEDGGIFSPNFEFRAMVDPKQDP
jgi:hypothetical protein